MWNCATILSALVLTAYAVTIGDPNKLYSQSGQSKPQGDGGGDSPGLGNPTDWTMSKANLVAEFYANEPILSQKSPNLPPSTRDRSHKSMFSFLNNAKNPNGVPVQGNTENLPPHGYSKHINGNMNLVASGTTYNQQAVLNPSPGGYSTHFKPIKFPQQNFIIPQNKPDSGYPPNFRTRGPPQSPYWNSNNGPTNNPAPPPYINGPANNPAPLPYINGPANNPAPPPYINGPANNPAPLPYINGPANNPAPPPFTNGLRPPNPPPPPYLPPQRGLPSQGPPVQNQPPLHLQNTIPAPPQYPVPKNNSVFIPSQQYITPPEQNIQTPQSGPPQILDTYRKQAVYPAQHTDRPLVYVMANSTSPASPSSENSFYARPSDSYTNYENNPVPPPRIQDQSQAQQPEPNLSALSTESLSQVLSGANAKAGEAIDKTIRFVIHKPEDEDVVKNAILEDAQNRYEDVKFVHGPTLKVQRKETVYLPPKKKTVVYILLKEPQIDTDVQVMSPQDDEPVPEVYITYQKSDGAVKTKHYSPKPIKQEEMKKYLDIEADSYSGQESRLTPRFSKSTSVSLSTSSSVSKKSSSILNTTLPDVSMPAKHEISSRDLANHKMVQDDTLPLKAPPLASNSSSVAAYSKRTRSPPSGAARRFLRYPIQCPTVT